VRWRDRIGDFRRDLGDGEHAEIMIAHRTYRVRQLLAEVPTLICSRPKSPGSRDTICCGGMQYVMGLASGLPLLSEAPVSIGRRQVSQIPCAGPRKGGRDDLGPSPDEGPHFATATDGIASRVKFAPDSPLEEAGFEPLVPRDTSKISRGAHAVSA
jgi:hypothetical protein